MNSSSPAPSSDGHETACFPRTLTPRVAAEMYIDRVEAIVRNNSHKSEAYSPFSGGRIDAIARIADRALAARILIPVCLARMRKDKERIDEAIINGLGEIEGVRRTLLFLYHGLPPLDVLKDRLQELGHWLAVEMPDLFTKCRFVARYLDPLSTADEGDIKALLDELAMIECRSVGVLARLKETKRGLSLPGPDDISRRVGRSKLLEAAERLSELLSPTLTPHDTDEPAGNLIGKTTKRKRTSQRGEGASKLIAALTKHHEYANGGCLNVEPIGNNELARLAGVSESTASAFFNKEFNNGESGGHAKYRAMCSDATQLVTALKLLNHEFSPHLLFGAKPANDSEHEDEA